MPRAIVGRTALRARGRGKGDKGDLLAGSGTDLAGIGRVAPCRTDTHQRWGGPCLPSWAYDQRGHGPTPGQLHGSGRR
eukprot:3340531-Pleurochrysis_carterae.AAC.1